MGAAWALADAARTAARVPDDAPLDLVAVAGAAGCDVRQRLMSAARGGPEAMLRPDTSEDRFIIELDPTPRGGWGDLSPDARAGLARRRLAFRVGHELGHTFYFDRRFGRAPVRRVANSEAQERWCDEFARALLIPPGAAASLSSSSSSVFELQRRYDTSLEVAARALSAAHPRAALALWYWPADYEAEDGCLLNQWRNFNDGAQVRAWRRSAVIDRALRAFHAWGRLPVAAVQAPADVRCCPERRQLLAMATTQ